MLTYKDLCCQNRSAPENKITLFHCRTLLKTINLSTLAQGAHETETLLLLKPPVMNKDKRIFRLRGKVMHYDWGGKHFLPSLLGMPNPDSKPFAEYWMGTHTLACSEIEHGKDCFPLAEWIKRDPEQMLGKDLHHRFESLPFLFKVLDVNQMLSIQVHPDKEGAKQGFEDEESRGIPQNSGQRNYKDNNHKPEMLVALSEFWLLHGFKPVDEVTAILQKHPHLNFLLPAFENESYEQLYSAITALDEAAVNVNLRPSVHEILSSTQSFSETEPEHWIKRFYENKNFDSIDPGVFSIYLMNIVGLQPGQATFQSAGLPHAYLSGKCIELMANSDNVLRGGLTSKHVDVEELMKHIKFEPTFPVIMDEEMSDEALIRYPIVADEFAISGFRLKKGRMHSYATESPEVCVVIEGKATTDSAFENMVAGDAFYILPDSHFLLKATEDCLLYRAYVPSVAELMNKH
jgi:mannose-6-phosphate isomerase